MLTGAAGLGAMLLGACNPKEELLAPQQPGVISPADVQSPTGAEGLYNGAVGNFMRALVAGSGNQETIWQFSGLLADEWKTADTFSQRNDADQRITKTNDGLLGPLYQTLQQSRGSARTALTYLRQFEPTSSATHQAEMYFVIAFDEMQLAEDFCNGIPLGVTIDGQPDYKNDLPLSTKDVYTVAMARADSGLALLGSASDAASVQVRNALLVTKGRIQTQLGQFSAAAATVASVPVTFQYASQFSQPTTDNGNWTISPNSRRYSVSDSTDATGVVKNALPFVSAKDPRVPTSLSSNKTGSDGLTPLYVTSIWGRDDPIPVVDGLDAQLIQAEAKVNAGDIAGMMTILNALRAAPPAQGIFKPSGTLAPLAAPATKDAAISLLFREKAFWTFGRGQRLGDLRRLVRVYQRTQDQVYPTGAFFKNGNYGSIMFFPVPDNERSNPNFKGCFDQNP